MQVADINKVDPVFASILHGFFCKINMKKKMTKEVPEVELYTMDFPHAVYKGFIVLNKVKVFSFILFFSFFAIWFFSGCEKKNTPQIIHSDSYLNTTLRGTFMYERLQARAHAAA